MRTNAKTAKSHVYEETRLAGGYGPRAAKQGAEAQLRRLVMACLLWEDIAYADGQHVVESIKQLVPQVPADVVSKMAVEARFQQKLRHVPLLLCREMARLDSHRGLVADTLAQVINRPDELCEFVSIYWNDNGKRTLSAQVKKGLARAFNKFDEYQLAKWDKEGRDVKLRDVLFLCHAKPKDEQLFKRLVDRKLATPDTWEVGLSAAKGADEKRAVWERLIADNSLGALAFLKNLRNLQDVQVPRAVIAKGFSQLKPTMLLPIDFLRAARFAPDFTRQLEDLMYACAAQWPKLPGWTMFVVDVSGSMGSRLSAKTEFTRMDAAAAMAMLAAEMCEQVTIYATAGCDQRRIHATAKIEPLRGFALAKEIVGQAARLGGGGIFTRQCLEFIREKEHDSPARIVIFSDSQDCDRDSTKQPKPFGDANYIVDVSAHSHGVNYLGVWTAEISGWSEHFLRFIAELENTLTQ